MIIIRDKILNKFCFNLITMSVCTYKLLSMQGRWPPTTYCTLCSECHRGQRQESCTIRRRLFPLYPLPCNGRPSGRSTTFKCHPQAKFHDNGGSLRRRAYRNGSGKRPRKCEAGFPPLMACICTCSQQSSAAQGHLMASSCGTECSRLHTPLKCLSCMAVHKCTRG